VAAWQNWGSIAWNKVMDLEKDNRGNDPEEMVRFLTDIRACKDVAELVLHLKKICFITKTSGEQKQSVPCERGDRIEELFDRSH
jgi:hypothetical protein